MPLTIIKKETTISDIPACFDNFYLVFFQSGALRRKRRQRSEDSEAKTAKRIQNFFLPRGLFVVVVVVVVGKLF